MNRSRAEQRHHAERLISRRFHILRSVWGMKGDHYAGRAHQLAKFNLVCTCRHCSATREKYRDKPRPQFVGVVE